jgi:PBP4 family serine-type D-alanyl-D-alanine carboxypeptidase
LLRFGDLEESGYLRGDLVVKPSGDPTIGNAMAPDKPPDTAFRQLAQAIKAKGINYVRGNILIDCSAFDDQGIMGPGWAWDYQPNNYAPHVSLFAFNENQVAVSATATAVGQKCKIKTFPELPLFKLINNTITVSSNAGNGLKINRSRGTNEITVEGKLSTARKNESHLLTVARPDLVAAEALKASLQANAITIRGDVKISYQPVEPTAITQDNTIAIYQSPKLHQIIEYTNKKSDNFFAEQIYKSISLHTSGKGTYSATQEIEKQFLRRIGINPNNLTISDGSGLSRMNLVSPNSIVKLLRYMHKSKESKRFIESLPVSGKSGTLRHRMGNNGMLGRVIAKTGTIARVNCLSGYLHTRSGTTLVFSIMANNFSCNNGEISYVQNKICEALSNL